MRADLMAKLRLWILDNELTQEAAADILGITQSRVSNLVRGQWKNFNLDMLLTLAIKADLQCGKLQLHHIVYSFGRSGKAS